MDPQPLPADAPEEEDGIILYGAKLLLKGRLSEQRDQWMFVCEELAHKDIWIVPVGCFSGWAERIVGRRRIPSIGGPILPEQGVVYRHYKGDLYRVITSGRLLGGFVAGQDTWMTVYRSMSRGYIWIRPTTMFLERMTWPDGVERTRFTPDASFTA